jgi:DNA-directed RNA polymerase alpha subunit
MIEVNDFWNEPEYQALHEIPIEQLGLSPETVHLLKETGITSIGDCVDLYHLFRYATVSISSRVVEVLVNDVKEKLQEHDYWKHVEENLENRGNKPIVPAEDKNPYEIPIQQLDLAANTVELLESVGITSIGDCLDFVERGADTTFSGPSGLLDAMYLDVIPKLKAYGYMS